MTEAVRRWYRDWWENSGAEGEPLTEEELDAILARVEASPEMATAEEYAAYGVLWKLPWEYIRWVRKVVTGLVGEVRRLRRVAKELEESTYGG